MRCHGMSSISQKYNFAIPVRPLIQGLAIVDQPLRGLLRHELDGLLHSFLETLECLEDILLATECRPAFPQVTQVFLLLGDKRDNVESLVVGNREAQEVAVLAEPGHGVSIETPPALDL